MSETKSLHEANRSRYPNSLPDLTPAQSYGAEDARIALERASFLLKQVRLLLPEK
ncbi:MAG: hypothetical protein ABIL11_11925 [Chloroflexota bacterium]